MRKRKWEVTDETNKSQWFVSDACAVKCLLRLAARGRPVLIHHHTRPLARGWRELGNRTKKSNISACFDPLVIQELQEICRKNGWGISEFVRAAVREKLNKEALK